MTKKEFAKLLFEKGVFTTRTEAEKKEIDSSHIYQDLKRLVKEQELMALGTVQEIYDYLMER